MATATAAITSKTEEVDQFREAIAAGSKELSELKEKLARANGVVASLESKRDKFANDAADGKPQKSVAVASLLSEIAEARLPIESLQNRVSQKEGELERVRASLETLNRSIAMEEAAASRRARFDALAKQGREVTARVAEAVRALIETDLPKLETVRQDIFREFVANPGEFSAPGRELIAGFVAQLMDGPYPRAERTLLRAGYTASGLELPLRTLRPPKRSRDGTR